jgi:hypothetical protein
MSELVPALLPLDKGLNLQTAKLIAPPGSVLDSLNYEQVDFQGQKRIDGYTRYDGSLLSALDEYYVITVASAAAAEAGNLLSGDDGLIGVIASISGNILYVGMINDNNVPAVADTVTFLESGVSVGTSTVTAVSTGTLSGATADEHYAKLLELNTSIRSRVESLPGAIIGLHWFEDRLYAVADVNTITLDGTTPTLYPNDTIVCGGDSATVLGSVVATNTRIVFINSLNTTAWTTEGADVTRNAVSVGDIANGFETLAVASEVASFFESRSELQVLDEDSGPYDFGWRFVHLGWSVSFENGLSLFGSLPAINQNIDGIGIQGPTSITGNNGRPLVLLQKVNIINGTTQVNGWKSSQTPTSYLLDADDLTTVDADYVYADAFLSWDGTTGAISAPGITTSTLPEYPATNTVEVDI